MEQSGTLITREAMEHSGSTPHLCLVVVVLKVYKQGRLNGLWQRPLKIGMCGPFV